MSTIADRKRRLANPLDEPEVKEFIELIGQDEDFGYYLDRDDMYRMWDLKLAAFCKQELFSEEWFWAGLEFIRAQLNEDLPEKRRCGKRPSNASLADRLVRHLQAHGWALVECRAACEALKYGKSGYDESRRKLAQAADWRFEIEDLLTRIYLGKEPTQPPTSNDFMPELTELAKKLGKNGQ